MRHVLVALALLAGAEGAALACSCIPPMPPEQARDIAREAVQGAVAIVEAEAISGYRPGGPGEQVRVHRILFGHAPQLLHIQRSDFASSASCDLLLTVGERKVLILERGEGGAYRMQSLCSDYLASEEYLPVTLEEAARARTVKAGERAATCPKARGARVAG
jgi:hypothetical protein